MRRALGRWAAVFVLAMAVLFSLGSHVNAELHSHLHSHKEIVGNVKVAFVKIQEQKTFNKKQTRAQKNSNKREPSSRRQEEGLFLISFQKWLLPRIYQSGYLSFSSGIVSIHQKEMEEKIDVRNSGVILL